MRSIYLLIFSLNILSVLSDPNKIPKDLQDAGYKFSVYTVQTSDNYLLRHYRIYPKNSPGNGKIVVMAAGLGQSGEGFVRLGPDYALAYNLVNIGCEVWLLNFRGTSYSLGHTQLSSLDSKYWEFSFHEMGMYDLPASIDFILQETKQASVIYLGYSEGANAGFVMLSQKPEYNTKLKSMITIAPLPFGCHATSTNANIIGFLERFRVLSAIFNSINLNLFFFLAPIQDFLSVLIQNDLIRFIFEFLEKIISNNDCKGKLFTGFLANGDREQLGSRQITHFAQLFSDCNFRPYKGLFMDYPKPYDLFNVATDIYAITADKDDLCTPENLELLKNALPKGFKGAYHVNKTHGGIINCPAGSSDLNNIIDSIVLSL